MGLFLSIKKEIVKGQMTKKRKNKPFNIESDERYVLKEDADIMQNNSYFFGGYDVKNEKALVLRLGIRNTDYFEVFVMYKDHDKFYVNNQDYYKKTQNPLSITCLVPGEVWEVKFEGILVDQATGLNHQVTFSFEWNARRPIFDFFYTESSPFIILSTAKAKWNKEFRNTTSKHEQRHYEQKGYMKGQIIIDNQQYTLDMPSGRDHSFGYRDWNDMREHLWLFAFNEKGEIFNYSLVDYPLLKNIQCGYSDFGKEKLVSIKKNTFKHYDFQNGLGDNNLALEMTLNDNEVLNVQVNRLNNQKTEYQQGDYYFQEGIAVFDINGTKALGSLEYGFNKDPNLWVKEREVK